jgi:hypothetical protein
MLPTIALPFFLSFSFSFSFLVFNGQDAMSISPIYDWLTIFYLINSYHLSMHGVIRAYPLLKIQDIHHNTYIKVDRIPYDFFKIIKF